MEFKYISCYSLSSMLSLRHSLLLHLNTSHVILYPAYLSHFLTVILLQPLYLSGFLLYFTTLDPLFQFLP